MLPRTVWEKWGERWGLKKATLPRYAEIGFGLKTTPGKGRKFPADLDRKRGMKEEKTTRR